MIAIQLQCYMYAQEGVSPQLNTISVSSIQNSQIFLEVVTANNVNLHLQPHCFWNFIDLNKKGAVKITSPDGIEVPRKTPFLLFRYPIF